MTQQHITAQFHALPDTTTQTVSTKADNMNPRIIQLDTLLNRSHFIWNRQQASNNN